MRTSLCLGGWTVFLVQACSAPPLSAAASMAQDQAVAWVEQTPIGVVQLKREMRRLSPWPSTQAPDSELARVALGHLVDRRLWLLAAEQAQIYVERATVERGMRRLQAGYSAAEFAQILRQQDLTASELRRVLHDDLRIEGFVRDQVEARQVVTEPELAAGLEARRAAQPAQRRLRHLMVDAPEAAADIAQKIKRGMPFDEAARQFSRSADRERGGDLGRLGRADLPEAVAAACFELPLRQLSPVVHTDYGYHLFMVIERLAAGHVEPQQVRQALIREKNQRASAQMLASLRARAKVQVLEERLAHIL
jgi:peptidyl-prolyl cis-trans isomerase C